MLHNTQGDTVFQITYDLEDKIMKALPAPIAEYVQYDATANMCVASIYKLWRGGMSVQQLMYELRKQQRSHTMETYGTAHPQAWLA